MDRYSRQELVIGKKSQKTLANSKVVIVGLGALGSVVLELLARAGIGEVTIIDRDIVEESNLQRQLLYDESDIAKPKAGAAESKIKKINSKIKINSYISDLNYRNVEILESHSLILDCSDNMYTRFLVNEFSRKNKIPWIYAGAIKNYGNVMLIKESTPCFRCIFKEGGLYETCDTVGVLNTLTTTIASIQVNKAIEEILCDDPQKKSQNSQTLIHFDIDSLELHSIKTSYDQNCPVCSGQYKYLDGEKEPEVLSYKCSGVYHFDIGKLDIKKLRPVLSKLGEIKGDEKHLFFKNLSIFENGKVMVRAKDKDLAKADLSKYLGV